MVGRLLAVWGRWDVLVSNAAVAITKPFSQVSEAEFSPGATETETYRDGKSHQFLSSLEAMSAFGRLGTPDEIAGVVAFLASETAGSVTAQNIRVNGGTV